MTRLELFSHNESVVIGLGLQDQAVVSTLLVTARRMADRGIEYKPYQATESGAHKIQPVSTDGSQLSGI